MLFLNGLLLLMSIIIMFFLFVFFSEKKFFSILYSNIDGLLNKKDEHMSFIEKDQPMIIALTEIKPKRQYDFNIAEYNIPGYTLFVSNQIKRGVAIYAKFMTYLFSLQRQNCIIDHCTYVHGLALS